MSGKSTRLGVSLAAGHWSNATEAIGLIALFVVGAAGGSLIVEMRSKFYQCWVLFTETFLLGAAALCYDSGAAPLAIAAIVLAMGLEIRCFRPKAVLASA
jgi:uncharacterized membrane protein YoaK (UPF0700 family)